MAVVQAIVGRQALAAAAAAALVWRERAVRAGWVPLVPLAQTMERQVVPLLPHPIAHLFKVAALVLVAVLVLLMVAMVDRLRQGLRAVRAVVANQQLPFILAAALAGLRAT
jgi:hypothetical protein